jgi:hypothetical protein
VFMCFPLPPVPWSFLSKKKINTICLLEKASSSTYFTQQFQKGLRISPTPRNISGTPLTSNNTEHMTCEEECLKSTSLSRQCLNSLTVYDARNARHNIKFIRVSLQQGNSQRYWITWYRYCVIYVRYWRDDNGDGGIKFLRHVDIHLPLYTASHPQRP